MKIKLFDKFVDGKEENEGRKRERTTSKIICFLMKPVFFFYISFYPITCGFDMQNQNMIMPNIQSPTHFLYCILLVGMLNIPLLVNKPFFRVKITSQEIANALFGTRLDPKRFAHHVNYSSLWSVIDICACLAWCSSLLNINLFVPESAIIFWCMTIATFMTRFETRILCRWKRPLDRSLYVSSTFVFTYVTAILAGMGHMWNTMFWTVPLALVQCMLLMNILYQHVNSDIHTD